MLEVKDAVAAAIAAAKTFYSGENLQQIELEEVELSSDERSWLITLGFDVPDTSPLTGLAAAIIFNGPRVKRKYKVFTIDRVAGKVTSMKIRDI